MADPIFTVVGDSMDLYVEADDHFVSDVSVSFAASVQDDETKTEDIVFFEETLKAVVTPVRKPNAPPTVKASLITWKVNVAKDTRFRGRTATLTFVVEGAGVKGNSVHAVSSNELQIVSIGVTDNKACLRIMLHEFPVDVLGLLVVDRERLFAVVEALSVQQRRLLLSHAKATPQGRLVVFITRMASGDRTMHADFGAGTGTSVQPNASFAVFACRDLTKEGITLVCFTEHFLINTANGPTRALLASTQDGKPPAGWRSVDNPKPVQFRIASQLPGHDNDGVMWSCLYAANGKNVMKHNTIHGMINTIGCWMLFRNFNWPREQATGFQRVYTRLRNTLAVLRRAKFKGRMHPSMQIPATAELVTLGYDAITPTPGESTSFDKFYLFDRNFAYLWFFHDIVGIRYFARGLDWYSERRIANDRDVTGLTLRATFPLAEAGKATPTNTAAEGDCTTHDVDYRAKFDLKTAPVVPIDNSLWQKNVLGFAASTTFIPARGRYGDLTAAELASCAWADVYLYGV